MRSPSTWLKVLKEPVLFFEGDANAGISHAQFYGAGPDFALILYPLRLHLGTNGNAALMGKFDGIAYQVQQKPARAFGSCRSG